MQRGASALLFSLIILTASRCIASDTAEEYHPNPSPRSIMPRKVVRTPNDVTGLTARKTFSYKPSRKTKRICTDAKMDLLNLAGVLESADHFMTVLTSRSSLAASAYPRTEKTSKMILDYDAELLPDLIKIQQALKNEPRKVLPADVLSCINTILKEPIPMGDGISVLYYYLKNFGSGAA